MWPVIFSHHFNVTETKRLGLNLIHRTLICKALGQNHIQAEINNKQLG